MYILLDVDHERHLGGQPHEAEVHQPPPVVGFEGQAVSRGEKRARCAGTRDALVADKSTAYQSVSSFFSWALVFEIRLTSEPRIAAKKIVRFISPPAKSP